MDRRNLTLDIRADNIGPKRVNVRGSLMVGNLIASVKDKFNLDGEFRLNGRGHPNRWRLRRPLDHAGVDDDSTLRARDRATGTLDAIRGGERHAFSKSFKRVAGGGQHPGRVRSRVATGRHRP
jgi:hypothetical protein